MARSGSKAGSVRASRSIVAFIATAVLFVLIPLLMPLGRANAQTAADANRRCLGCHSMRGLTKKLDNGQALNLQIPTDQFAHSAHATVGCSGCHTDITLPQHPMQRKSIASARDFSVQAVQVCKTCHADRFAEWQGSIHAALVGAGNAAGPICTSCHAPHTVVKDTPETVENVPCKSCHADIFTAYAASVHGQARITGDAAAPLCSGCHNAHNVSVASSPSGPRNACLTCHDGVEAQHAAWLPDAALHFEVVSCPACHVPNAPRRVDLQLVDAEQVRVAEPAGVPTFQAPGKGVDAIALYDLLNTTGNAVAGRRVALRGRLEVATPAATHQLAPKSEAIRSCATCHSPVSEAFQSVSVSVAGPDGLPVRTVLDRGVLTSVRSIGSIGGFYAIGATRIELFDILLGLAVLAGIGLPAAHLLAGFVLRRNFRRHDPPPPGDA